MADTDPNPAIDAASYGDAFADVYDQWYVEEPLDDVVAALAESAGPILELGVGTGRIALALAGLGHEVWGVDSSSAMLATLGRKDLDGLVRTVRQDMAQLDLGRARFATVVAAFNVLFNLPDIEAKRSCFAGVARHLAPGGVFVVDTVVPADADMAPRAEVASVDADGPVLTVSEHHHRDRVIRGQHIDVTEGDVNLRPWRLHYVWPDEIDRLAADAGLVREQRWSDWNATPVDSDSHRVVSWYRRR